LSLENWMPQGLLYEDNIMFRQVCQWLCTIASLSRFVEVED